MTAGNRRRWSDKDNENDDEFPVVAGTVNGSSGKPECLADRVNKIEHCSLGSYDARCNLDFYYFDD